MRASNKGFKPKSQHLANGGLVQNAAEYWSEDNAAFEKTNPGVGSRILRAANPLTAFGSAMGAMQDSSNAGDGAGMALAAAQAIPVFSMMRAAGPLVKAAGGLVPSVAKTAAATVGNTAFGVGADMYQPNGEKVVQNFANGGMVKGAGTGTSDDIKKNVAAGSYIMPADSTKQIGSESLQGLGFQPQNKQVPVNLSNGEYQLPPEQVHAVGVQALDQMKGATHTPVQEEGAKGFKPEMFFANGGEVDPEKRKQSANIGSAIGTAANNTFASMNAHALPETSRVTSESIDNVGDEFSKGNYLRGVGAGLGGVAKVAGGLGFDLIARPIGGIAGGIGEVGKGFFGINDSPQAAAPAAAKPSVVNSTPKIVPNPMTAVASPAAQVATPPVVIGSPVDTSTQVQTAPVANNVTREGNSYSGGSVGLGFTVNGQSFGGNGITSTNPQANSAQNVAAKQELFDRTPTFGEGQPAAQGFAPNRGRGVIIGQQENPLVEQARKDAYRANSTVIQGARGLTSSQRAGLQAIGDKVDANNLSRETTSANNLSQITQAQMREQGANSRAALNEQGANYRSDSANDSANQRFNVTSGLDERRFASDQETKGFATRAARRTEKLYERYEKAGQEERKAIAQQIQELGGKSTADKFLTVQGGQEYDQQAMTLVNRPARLFNADTQQFVDQQKAAPPPIDQNPAVAAIVNNTKLSVDDKRKQLQAMGYN